MPDDHDPIETSREWKHEMATPTEHILARQRNASASTITP